MTRMRQFIYGERWSQRKARIARIIIGKNTRRRKTIDDELTDRNIIGF